MAKNLCIPKAFLSKILQQLARGGVVRSSKGPSGGFSLSCDPGKLSVQHIVSGIDGPLRLFDCFSDGSDCTHFGNCKILAVFDRVKDEVGKALSRVMLADFIDPESVREICGSCSSSVPDEAREALKTAMRAMPTKGSASLK